MGLVRLRSLEVALVVCGEGLLGIRLSSMGWVMLVLLIVGVLMGMLRLLPGLQMALVEAVLLVTFSMVLRGGEGMLRERVVDSRVVMLVGRMNGEFKDMPKRLLRVLVAFVLQFWGGGRALGHAVGHARGPAGVVDH
jgi:lysylphosphatidylglycerol synthetase-like protein (DUF2156 family)